MPSSTTLYKLFALLLMDFKNIFMAAPPPPSDLPVDEWLKELGSNFMS